MKALSLLAHSRAGRRSQCREGFATAATGRLTLADPSLVTIRLVAEIGERPRNS